MSEKSELQRQLADLALDYARSLTSKQTGFLHFCPDKPEGEPHLAIPVVENFLYALALFRSRTVEQVNEGMQLLEKLLPFQNQLSGSEMYGNFPLYLHEYPVCRDRSVAIQVAFIILLLIKQFASVLPSALKSNLEDALKRALHSAWEWVHERRPPAFWAARLAASSIAAQELWQDASSFQQRGMRLLQELFSSHPADLFFCSAHLGALLCSLALIEKSAAARFKESFERAVDLWHAELGCYVGPAYREWQVGYGLQVNILDYFLGYATQKLPEQLMKKAPPQLEALLIPPLDLQPRAAAYPETFTGATDGAAWRLYKAEKFAYSLFERTPHTLNPIWEKGYHPFRLLWGAGSRVHSFASQKGSCYPVIQVEDPCRIHFIYELDLPPKEEGLEKNREILFFLDAAEPLQFLVAGVPASTFQLGDLVALQCGSLSLELRFLLEEGEGTFLGHRMLGNRPAQLETKGVGRFDAYDWVIFLRTVHRTQKCRIRAVLNIYENS